MMDDIQHAANLIHTAEHVVVLTGAGSSTPSGIPDFRSGERTFQLLSQVTGRAGRGESPGQVIIQTMNPQHYSISTTQFHDYNALYKRELELRKKLQFPPFTRLINFRIEGKSENAVKSTAKNIAMVAKKLSGKYSSVNVLGPAPAPLSRLHGKHRWQLLLKGSEFKTLHAICTALLENQRGRGGTKLTVDVDPENML